MSVAAIEAYDGVLAAHVVAGTVGLVLGAVALVAEHPRVSESRRDRLRIGRGDSRDHGDRPRCPGGVGALVGLPVIERRVSHIKEGLASVRRIP
jgi:hypothetical protein